MNNAFPRSYRPPRRTRTRSCLLLVLTAALLGGAVGFWKGYDEEFYFNLEVAAHNTRWGVNRGIDYTNEAARHAGYRMLDGVERVGDEVTNRLGQVKEVGVGVKERVGGVVGDVERWRDARILGGMEEAQNLALSGREGHRVEGTRRGSEVSNVFGEDDDDGDVEDGIVVTASIGDGEGGSEWPTDLPLEGAADAIWDEEKW